MNENSILIDIRNWMKDRSDLQPDQRFWNIDEMSIEDIFNWLNTYKFNNDELLYKMILFVKDNNLI